MSPGLYRLRRRGRPGLDYLGQTRRTLRGRVRMLGGVFGDEMPFRDPHTAGPALWAMRHANPCSFEVSVVEVDTEPSWRKGLEALAISLYGQRWHESPTVNFGRMPAGYRDVERTQRAARGGRAASFAAGPRQNRWRTTNRACRRRDLSMMTSTGDTGAVTNGATGSPWNTSRRSGPSARASVASTRSVSEAGARPDRYDGGPTTADRPKRLSRFAPNVVAPCADRTTGGSRRPRPDKRSRTRGGRGTARHEEAAA